MGRRFEASVPGHRLSTAGTGLRISPPHRIRIVIKTKGIANGVEARNPDDAGGH